MRIKAKIDIELEIVLLNKTMRIKAKIDIELEIVLLNSEEKQIVKKGSNINLNLELKPTTKYEDTTDYIINVDTEVVDVVAKQVILKQKGKKESVIETTYYILLKVIKIHNSPYGTMRSREYEELYIEDIIRVPATELLDNGDSISRWCIQ